MQKHNYWDELCGTNAWKNLELGKVQPKSLAIFDHWYLEFYLYLKKYLPISQMIDSKVLEIGLGFGTVGQLLFKNCADYVGCDFAQGPVDMMNKRIKYCGKENNAVAIRGDARNLSFRDKTFDIVISVGCLHHTGDLHKSIKEIYRVLKSNGIAIVMVYNKYSFRQFVVIPFKYLVNRMKGKKQKYSDFVKACYDCNSEGKPPPETVFCTKQDVTKYFSPFSHVSMKLENFEDLPLPKTGIIIPRKLLLNNLAKLIGLDIYIKAIK